MNRFQHATSKIPWLVLSILGITMGVCQLMYNPQYSVVLSIGNPYIKIENLPVEQIIHATSRVNEKILLQVRPYLLLLLRCPRVENLAILFEPLDHVLPPLARHPFGKVFSLLRIGCLGPNQQVGRIQKEIVLAVRAGLVHDRLLPHVRIERENGASVRQRVLVQQNGGSQCLNRESNVLVIPRRVGCSPRNLCRISIGCSQ